MIRPKALQPGSKVAVIAPGGKVDKAKLDEGASTLRTLGFEPVFGENIVKSRYQFAGADEERLSDLLWALTDPAIEGVVCARGGEGSTDLLPWLESSNVEPRVFCGYSDVTAIHAWLQRNGWITFHGPMAAVEMAKGGSFDMDSFLGEVTGLRTNHSLPIRFLKPGQADGTLTGGCLSLLAALCGTPWSLPWGGRSILLLEDTGEPPYKLHRMLTQLRDAQVLRDVSGIVFGTMDKCEADPKDGFTLGEVLLDALEGFEGPIAIGLPAGHCKEPAVTLPLGTRVLLAPDEHGGEARLHLMELGVS